MPISVHINKGDNSEEVHLYENATRFRYNAQSRMVEIQTKNGKTIAVYTEYQLSYLTLEDPKISSSKVPPQSVKLDQKVRFFTCDRCEEKIPPENPHHLRIVYNDKCPEDSLVGNWDLCPKCWDIIGVFLGKDEN